MCNGHMHCGSHEQVPNSKQYKLSRQLFGRMSAYGAGGQTPEETCLSRDALLKDGENSGQVSPWYHTFPFSLSGRRLFPDFLLSKVVGKFFLLEVSIFHACLRINIS
jgi:hypothetical protein